MVQEGEINIWNSKNKAIISGNLSVQLSFWILNSLKFVLLLLVKKREHSYLFTIASCMGTMNDSRSQKYQKYLCIICIISNIYIQSENAGDIRDTDLIPGLKRSSGGEHENPLKYFCLKNTMGKEVWQAMQGLTKSQTQLK